MPVSIFKKYIEESEMSNHILTVKEVAEYLSISESTVYKMVREGAIPAAKIGNSWRFLQNVIDKWLEQIMMKNVHQELDNIEDIEFTPHALGKIQGELSREDIYSDR